MFILGFLKWDDHIPMQNYRMISLCGKEDKVDQTGSANKWQSKGKQIKNLTLFISIFNQATQTSFQNMDWRYHNHERSNPDSQKKKKKTRQKNLRQIKRLKSNILKNKIEIKSRGRRLITRFLRRAVGPFGEGEVNLLAINRFGFVGLFEALPH